MEYNWFSLSGWIFGAIGAIIAIKSYRSSKYIFDLADKHIKKDINEEELKQLRYQIKEKQDQIKRDIPNQARRTVLSDRLNTELEQLGKDYYSVLKTKDEISKLGVSIEIPKEILKFIDKEISPSYLRKEKVNKAKTYVTFFTTLAAIFSTILPNPLNKIGYGFLLITVPQLILLIWYTLPNDREERKQFLFRGAFWTSLLLFFLDCVLIHISTDYHMAETLNIDRSLSEVVTVAALVTLPILLILLIIFAVLNLRLNKKTNGFYFYKSSTHQHISKVNDDPT